MPAAPEPSAPTSQEIERQLRPGRIARGIQVFVAIGVVASVVLLALTVNRDTVAGLGRIRWYWLATTGLLWLLSVVADGARLAVLSRAGEHPMGVVRSAEIILVGYFMAAITPFQVGGLPLQLYSMSRWGISPGRASSVLLARGVLFYGLVFALAPFIAWQLDVSSALFKVLWGYIGVIVGGGAALIIFGLVFPGVIRRWQARLAGRDRAGRWTRVLARLLAESLCFLDGLKLFGRGRNLGLLALAFCLTVAYAACYFGMGATLLAGLDLLRPGDALRATGTNLLLTAVLLFIPTPGASGVAEAGAAGLYALLCPKHMLGIFVVLWRVFSFYAGAFVGGAVALRHVTAPRPRGNP